MIPSKDDIREAIVLADKGGYAIPQVIKDLTVAYLTGELVEKSQKIDIINMKLENIKLAIDDITKALSPEAEKECSECKGTGGMFFTGGLVGKPQTLISENHCPKCNGTGKRKEK